MSAYLKPGAKGVRFGVPVVPRPQPVRGFDPAQQSRRAMLAKVHLAKKSLELDDDDYRVVLKELTGKASAGDCSEAELAKVIDWAKAKGWQATPKRPAPRAADHKSAMKARALWISLHHLAAIDDPSESALEAFARRQLKCDRLQWADQALTYKLIEALKAMAQRHGWDQRVQGAQTAEGAIRKLKVNLLKAQADKLRARGLAHHAWTLPVIAERLADYRGFGSPLQWPKGDLDRLAAAFGKLIRKEEENDHAAS